MKTEIVFGEYLPDLPAHGHPGLTEASGVYPGTNGYRPVKAFSALDNPTLPADCLGAAVFRSSAGRTRIYAGTSGGLYQYRGTGWSSASSGLIGASPEHGWRFEQFGDLAVATNGADPPQKIALTAADAQASPLGGAPPKFRYLAVVRDFLVGGVRNGDTDTMQWSAVNNAEGWTIGSDQSDFQIFPSGGAITGLAGGEFGLVFQERAIKRMSYIGGNLIFQFDELSANIGCIAPRSLISLGRLSFFLSDQGFMRCDGEQIEPIGNERVDRTFLGAAVRAHYGRMTAAIDPANKLVIWTLPDDSTPSTWYIYNWAIDRWSTVSQGAQFLMSGAVRDTDMEDLGALFATMEDVAPGLDDASWLGGVPLLYVIDDLRQLGTMSGANVAATLSLGDIEFVPGRWARVNAVRPIADAGSGLTLTVGGRARLGDAVTSTAYGSLQASGDMPTRETWRHFRLSLDVASGEAWTYAQGLEVDFEPMGTR